MNSLIVVIGFLVTSSKSKIAALVSVPIDLANSIYLNNESPGVSLSSIVRLSQFTNNNKVLNNQTLNNLIFILLFIIF